MIPAEAEVRVAAAALAVVVHRDPLHDLLARWTAEPWRVLVGGRVGAGKSTLVNAWFGEKVQPTGLGGVTRDARPLRRGTVEIIDTPGIDAEDEGTAVLAPLAALADAVVWVVDGLQPLTASERNVIAKALPPRIPLTLVVSRADLIDPEERGSVHDRVARLATGWAVAGIHLLDLRREIPPVPAPGVTPRRLVAVTDALQAARAALDALPPVTSPEQVLKALREAWHTEVRAVESGIEAEIERGQVDHKEAALRRLALLAPAAHAKFLERAGALGVPLPSGLPDLPTLAPHEPTFRDAFSVFAGREGARRALRAAAGGLAQDGDLVLADWVADGVAGALVVERRRVARRAVEAAFSAIPPLG